MTCKIRLTTCLGAMAMLLICASAAHAEHFEIHLTLTTPSGDQTSSFSDTSTAQTPQGFKPRPVAHVKAGDELVFQFFCSSNFPHDSIKQVTIRYYIVPEEKAGQSKVPGREHALVEGAFVMDFKPQTGKVGLRQRLTLDKAGTYLVRVESDNSDNDHEHFSAIDLVVE